eukprot:6095570-Pyramimonas_sp.AAC.1
MPGRLKARIVDVRAPSGVDIEAWATRFPSLAGGARGQEAGSGDVQSKSAPAAFEVKYGTNVPQLDDRQVALLHGFDSPSAVVDFSRSLGRGGPEFYEEPAEW